MVVKTAGVDFFCYHRDRACSMTLRAELLEEHWSYMDRRWDNLLGRTMWDFPGGPDRGHRYLVLGLGAGPAADLAVPPGREELIAYGPLLSDNSATWLGTAALVRAPDPGTARAVLTMDRYASIEVHGWQFGGRPA